MTGMHALWLPIVLSAVIVFIASSVLHMVVPGWHASDFAKVPNEDAVMDALRPFAIPPGDYVMPRPGSMADMRSAEFKAKNDKGPRVVMTVLTNGFGGMSGQLSQWFVFCLVMSVFSAYVAGRSQPVGANYLHVFRFAGVTAFLGYSAALWPLSIWYKRSLQTTIKATIDGLIFGLLTAGTFGWLWPR